MTYQDDNPVWKINSGLRKENEKLLNRALKAEARVEELEKGMRIGTLPRLSRDDVLKLIKESKGTRLDLSRKDLSGLFLSGLNFRGALFYGSNLSDADFSDCDLSNASFIGANVTETNFAGAILYNANFDFSSWPLWCGTKYPVVDIRLAAQLAAHCTCIAVDAKELSEQQKELVKNFQRASYELGKTSHRAESLGIGKKVEKK